MVIDTCADFAAESGVDKLLQWCESGQIGVDAPEPQKISTTGRYRQFKIEAIRVTRNRIIQNSRTETSGASGG